MQGHAGDGILLVSKPIGMSSHDVVEQIRRSPVGLRRKVGHAGTLDPFATGLLIIVIGKATRVQRFFMSLPKTYRTRARFGLRSDTGDPTGNLTETGQRVDEGTIGTALPGLRGDIQQKVPLTSAVKVGGERLYRKARRGEEADTPVRQVTVSRLELCQFDAEAQAGVLEIECSSGTYVRQLITDLGELCGAGAYCETLERLAIGPFDVEDADAQRLIPLSSALEFLPVRRLEPAEARRARHGGAVAAGELGGTKPADVVRLVADGELIAVAECRDDLLKPVAVLSS